MMSRMCRALVVLLALMIAGASAAQAEDGPNYAEPGYYIVGQVGGAFFRKDVVTDLMVMRQATLTVRNEDCDVADPSTDWICVLADPGRPKNEPHSLHPEILGATYSLYEREVDNAVSFGLRLGHRWKHFGVEIDGDYVTGTVSNVNVTVNTKWYPWTSRVQPYLLAGMGIAYIKPALVDEQAKAVFGGTTLSIRLGAGAEVYITEHWFVDLGATYSYLTGPGNYNSIGTERTPGARSLSQAYFGVRGGVGYRFF